MNNDIFFIFYKKIINLNLLNDFIKEFKKDFREFKKVYREKYLLIKQLIDLK